MSVQVLLPLLQSELSSLTAHPLSSDITAQEVRCPAPALRSCAVRSSIAAAVKSCATCLLPSPAQFELDSGSRCASAPACLPVNSGPGAALSALQVLDRLAGGRAGIQSATVLDTSPDMLQLVQVLHIFPDLTPCNHSSTGSSSRSHSARSLPCSVDLGHTALPHPCPCLGSKAMTFNTMQLSSYAVPWLIRTYRDMLPIQSLDSTYRQCLGGRVPLHAAMPLHARLHGRLQDLAAAQTQQVGSGAKAWPAVSTQLMDPSLEVLPVEPHSFDVVISCLGLHWINDLPLLLPLRLQLVMAQCRFALVPDGLFLSAMFGGDTLQELRIACSVAHMERAGGVTPVVSPFAQVLGHCPWRHHQVRDGGNLLTRAGLALPAVDQDDFVVRYAAGPAEVVDHLRAMGESNAVQQRQRYLGKDVPLAAAAAYSNMLGSELDGSVQATYQELATGLVDSGKATGGSVGEAEDSGGGEGEQEGRETLDAANSKLQFRHQPPALQPSLAAALAPPAQPPALSNWLAAGLPYPTQPPAQPPALQPSLAAALAPPAQPPAQLPAPSKMSKGHYMRTLSCFEDIESEYEYGLPGVRPPLKALEAEQGRPHRGGDKNYSDQVEYLKDCVFTIKMWLQDKFPKHYQAAREMKKKPGMTSAEAMALMDRPVESVPTPLRLLKRGRQEQGLHSPNAQSAKRILFGELQCEELGLDVAACADTLITQLQQQAGAVCGSSQGQAYKQVVGGVQEGVLVQLAAALSLPISTSKGGQQGMCGYALYGAMKRAGMEAQHPGVEAAQITKLLASAWACGGGAIQGVYNMYAAIANKLEGRK
ncbi:hypothetical protein QJQ45_023906 [Haematococcus lacustris]|nr:hypothetical protein QJQ45_023906 [Haematococcus lacustris]